MLKTAAYLLAKDAGLHVLLDGRTFSRRYQRERAIEFCSHLGTPWAMLECVCTEQTALGRLAEAMAQKSPPAANRTPRASPCAIDWPITTDTGLVGSATIA